MVFSIFCGIGEKRKIIGILQVVLDIGFNFLEVGFDPDSEGSLLLLANTLAVESSRVSVATIALENNPRGAFFILSQMRCKCSGFAAIPKTVYPIIYRAVGPPKQFPKPRP